MALITSLQVCMEYSSDCLQGSISEEMGVDSSSASGDMFTCSSSPLIERRLRPPQHDQSLKCPRCDSTHTKFCYYNNYSLTQPRYFCKTCRRYWTKGGTLRSIPVGGGCRKNKKVSSKKSTDQQSLNPNMVSSSTNNPTDLQLSFPEMMFSQPNYYSQGNHLNGELGNPNFIDTKYNNVLLENPRPIDYFMDIISTKYEALVGSSGDYDFTGNGDQLGMVVGGYGDMGGSHGLMSSNFHGFSSSSYGMSLDGNASGIFVDNNEKRLMLPYEGNEDQCAIDVKPKTKVLSLEWQDQSCSDTEKNSVEVCISSCRVADMDANMAEMDADMDAAGVFKIRFSSLSAATDIQCMICSLT